MNFFLNNNQYSADVVKAWKRDVFIRNMVSFNYAMGVPDSDFSGYLEGLSYNEELIRVVQNAYLDTDLVKLKAVFYAAGEDFVPLTQSVENMTIVLIVSYVLLGLYMAYNFGYKPN